MPAPVNLALPQMFKFALFANRGTTIIKVLARHVIQLARPATQLQLQSVFHAIQKPSNLALPASVVIPIA